MIVYFHTNKESSEVFYVGIGTNKKRAYNFKERNIYWHRYVKKYGLPNVKIIHDDLDKETCYQLEIDYIKKYGRKGIDENGILTNISVGGIDYEPLKKYKKEFPERNPAFKEINKLRMKENNPMHNPIYVEKIRKFNTGKIMSEETKRKCSDIKKGKKIEHLIGYKHSSEMIDKFKIINKEIANRPDVKEKLRLAALGRINKNTRKKIVKIHPKTNEELQTYDRIMDALIEFNKPKSGNISQVCRGNRNFAFGFKWKYLN